MRLRVIELTMPIPAVHPGEHLAEEIAELDMTAEALAYQIRVPTAQVAELLDGQAPITGDFALRLAHFFGTIPEFWLNLQKLYELRAAQEEVGALVDSLPTLKGLEASSVE